MIRRCLGEIRFGQFTCLVQICDESKGGSVALQCSFRQRISLIVKPIARTDVANDPVLHTVSTFSALTLPPNFSFTCSSNHSAPNLDISLFRPTSSSAIFFASATRSCAIQRASRPASIDVWRVVLRRRVAAPRFTAVGLAVKRKDNNGRTCASRAVGEVRKSGNGTRRRAREMYCAKDRAASEAIAGAPRI